MNAGEQAALRVMIDTAESTRRQAEALANGWAAIAQGAAMIANAHGETAMASAAQVAGLRRGFAAAGVHLQEAPDGRDE